MRQLATRALRLALAALAFAALVYQFSRGADVPNFSAVNFFSFFTNLSNIIGLVTFAVCGVFAARSERGDFDLLRGAATLYLATTGIVYWLLLRGVTEELGVVVPWVNIVVHTVMPLAVVVDWVANPPVRRIGVREARWWLLFPVAFLAYSLIRGPAAEWYPYPFLDHHEVGSAWGVATYCIAIAALLVIFAALLAWAGNTLRAGRAHRSTIGAREAAAARRR